jgi:hypothetical protein
MELPSLSSCLKETNIFGYSMKMPSLRYFLFPLVLKDLYDFVFFSSPQGQAYKFMLSTMYPKVTLSNVYLTIKEANIENMTQIVVSKL